MEIVIGIGHSLCRINNMGNIITQTNKPSNKSRKKTEQEILY